MVDALGTAGAPVPAVVAIDPGHACGRPPVLRDGVGRRTQRPRRVAERVPRRLVPRGRRRRATRGLGLLPRRARRGAPRRPRRGGDRVRRSARHGRRVGLLARRAARARRPSGRAPTPRGVRLVGRQHPAVGRRAARTLHGRRAAGERDRRRDRGRARWSTSRSRTSAIRSPTSGTACSSSVRTRHTAPLPGLPSEEETWARWSAATGRELVDLDYWMAFGATIIVVTATRASVMWGPPDSFSEDQSGTAPARGSRSCERGRRMSTDEHVHPFDPAVWSWNESWYFSWIDLDGGPAGFFRLGLLPNQERAMIWCYVLHDGDVVRHRGDPAPLRRLRPRRRHGVRPIRAAVRVATRRRRRRPFTYDGIVRDGHRSRRGRVRAASRSTSRRRRPPRSTAPAPAATWAASSTRRVGSSSRWRSPGRCASATRRTRCAPPGTATGRGARATGG